MSAVQTEQVLVVPTRLFHSLGYFQGFCSDVDRYLETLLDPQRTHYRRRGQVETDPSFKQLIPYVLIRFRKRGRTYLFQYKRGSGQGEKRLHALRSVGVGGHISNTDDGEQGAYAEGMRRELQEEVQIDTTYTERCVGLINDDSNSVGQVHLGVVHLLDVAAPRVQARESDIGSAEFLPLDKLLEDLDEFETWSQICLRGLFAAPAAEAG